MRRTQSNARTRGHCGTMLLIAAVVVAGCTESTAPGSAPAPRYVPTHTPEPAIGTFHVAIITTGVNPDPDGYRLTVDDTIAQPVRANDTVAVTRVVLGGHTLRLDGVATNCVADSAPAHRLFLASAHDTVAQFTVACVGAAVPPALDGTSLLFVRGGVIHRTTIGTDAAVALGAGEGPIWSPDGRRIAFLRGGDVYVMDADGANVRQIATGIPEPEWPPSQNGFAVISIDAGRRAVAWSPDGTRLAMYSDSAITIAPVDGADTLVRLDRHGASPYGELSGSPAWSPDGKQLAFVSDSWTETFDVFVGDVSGSTLSNVRKLTNASLTGAMYLQPAWSPDGTRIAMAACAQPEDYWKDPCAGSRIVVMHADGTEPRTLAYARGYARPVWSPDGQLVTFANTCWDHDCPSGILYVSADGSHAGMLVDDAHSPSLVR